MSKIGQKVTKKQRILELERQVAELQLRISLLEARPVYPIYPQYPEPNPVWPNIWYTTSTLSDGAIVETRQ